MSTVAGFHLSAVVAGIAALLYSAEVHGQQDTPRSSILEAYGLTSEDLDEVEFPLPGEVVDPEQDEPQEEPREEPEEDDGCTWDDPDCEDQGSAGLVEPDVATMRSQFDIQLVKIRGWPETKTEFKIRCVRIFGKSICTKWPIISKRTSTLWLLARVYYPDVADAERVARDCLAVAAVTGVISYIATMEPNVAAATLLTTLQECARRALGNLAQQFDLELKHTIEAGDWEPI